jgi:polysaccharide deacetylase 2 family uncharacterized protein YibQ
LLFAGLLCLCCVAGGAVEAAPRIAVVIDDFGLNYRTTPPDAEWIGLGFPITCAVMPESPRTRQAAEAIKAGGKEVIIHFPFDPFLSLELPKDGVSPRDTERVGALLDKSLKQIPQAAGLNTHRSYKATMNRPLMDSFLNRLKGKVGYFLDSRAAPKSVAYDMAREKGIPAAANDIFLEEPGHYNDAVFCGRIMRRVAAMARKRGSAVVIGHHYYRGTLACLKTEVPKLQAQGFSFVFASALAR